MTVTRLSTTKRCCRRSVRCRFSRKTTSTKHKQRVCTNKSCHQGGTGRHHRRQNNTLNNPRHPKRKRGNEKKLQTSSVSRPCVSLCRVVLQADRYLFLSPSRSLLKFSFRKDCLAARLCACKMVMFFGRIHVLVLWLRGGTRGEIPVLACFFFCFL